MESRLLSPLFSGKKSISPNGFRSGLILGSFAMAISINRHHHLQLVGLDLGYIDIHTQNTHELW